MLAFGQNGRTGLGFNCVSRTDVGLRREINEDSLLVRTERGLWAVADGMGGHDAGEVASAMVVEALRNVPIVYHIEELVENCIAALHKANRELIALAHSDARPRTIGSTIVALALAGNEYRCFWAGDSRAYRIRGGRIEQLTRDHSLVQDLVEAGMLEPVEAEHHPDANVITRAVGVTEGLKIDTVTGDARTGDMFLLASDGLTRVVEDDEILEELAANPLESAADRLIETVLARGAPDNVSLVIVGVT